MGGGAPRRPKKGGAPRRSKMGGGAPRGGAPRRPVKKQSTQNPPMPLFNPSHAPQRRPLTQARLSPSEHSACADAQCVCSTGTTFAAPWGLNGARPVQVPPILPQEGGVDPHIYQVNVGIHPKTVPKRHPPGRCRRPGPFFLGRAAIPAPTPKERRPDTVSTDRLTKSLIFTQL